MDDNVIDTLRIEIQGDSTNAVQGLEQLISTLERLRSATQNIQPPNFDTSAVVNETLSGYTQIQETIQEATAATQSFNQATQNINVDQFVKTHSQVDLLTMKLNDAKARLQELLNSGNTDSAAVANLTMQIQSLQDKIAAATSKTSIFKTVLSGAKKAALGFGSTLGKIAKAPFSAFGKAISGVKEKFSGLMTMFKKRLMYRLINAVISAITNAVKEGVNNVYQYSKAFGGTFSKSMDRAATSLLYFKNSIGAMVAPLINMLVPALEWVINKVVSFINVLNQLFAKLSGASTWTRALMYPKEYAKATDKANKAAKKWKATILGIDELNLMADNSDRGSGSSGDGMDYSSMFEEVALGATNSPLLNFFAPLMEAWRTGGQPVIDAVKQAFTSLITLGSSVGNTFNELWFGGRGQKSAELFLSILKNIFLIIGGIADRFNEAWNTDDIGLRITSAIWDVFDGIGSIIDTILGSTAEWVKTLNLEPVLNSLAGLFETLASVIKDIGPDISWLWQNVLLPLFSWLIEKILPRVIDTITGAVRSIKHVVNVIKGYIDVIVGILTLDFSKAWEGVKQVFTSLWVDIAWGDILKPAIMLIYEVIKPVVMWIYENIIVPVGDFFVELWGNVPAWAVEAWGYISDIWGAVSEWFDTNIIQPVVGFFVGLWDNISTKASECWDKIAEYFAPAIEWFSNTFNTVKETLSAVWNNISTIATECWVIIKRAWGLASSWFKERVITPVSTFFTGLWDKVKTSASDAWSKIKTVLTPVKEWIDEKIIRPVSGFFKSLWEGFSEKARSAWEGVKEIFGKVGTFFENTFRTAWQKVVNVFSAADEIFVDIKDGVISGFKVIVNALIKGINKVVKIPFEAINKTFTTLKNISILGVQPFTGLKPISIPEIPLLAGGGMVSAGTAFIAGEAGAEVVANVGNRTGVMNVDQMRESVAQGVVDANAEQNALLREEISILRRLLDKDWDVTTYVSTGNLIDGLSRKNRRDGKTVVPVGT